MEPEVFPVTDKAPTSLELADLTLDDTISDLERIAKYATTNIALQRLVHVKLISEISQSVGFSETQRVIFPLLNSISVDSEFIVRQQLAEELKGVAKTCVKDGSSVAYNSIQSEILPLVSRLISDSNAAVRVAAGETLVSIAGDIKRDDLGLFVLPIVLQLAHDDDDETSRMTAAILLNELAVILGPDLCAQFITTEFVCLTEDPVFQVRKSAALNLDAICRTIGPTVASKRLLPPLLRLTQDDIWIVRRACVEGVVAISKCLDPAVRVSELIPVYERFLSDSSKFVRTAALHQLGTFFATLPGSKITPSLLTHYIRMVNTNEAVPPSTNLPAATGSDPTEAETAVHCAFSFPAVVLTLGRNRWNELLPLFRTLAHDVHPRVRRPIACAMHELARILGSEVAEQDLVPVMDIFLTDIEEVSVGALKGLSAFIQALAPSARQHYLPVFQQLVTASMPHLWRVRKALAVQLGSFLTSYSPSEVVDYLQNLVLLLLMDPISGVREATAPVLPVLFHRLSQHPDKTHYNAVYTTITDLAKSSVYRERILYIHVCQALSIGLEPSEFRRLFLPLLLSLVKDKVRNVRHSLAQFLSGLSYSILSVDANAVRALPSDSSGADSVVPDEVTSEAREVDDGEHSTPSLNGESPVQTIESPFQGLDEVVFPLWAREGGVGGSFDSVLNCIEILSKDDDYEVVNSLDPKCVEALRGFELPDVLAYVKLQATPADSLMGTAPHDDGTDALRIVFADAALKAKAKAPVVTPPADFEINNRTAPVMGEVAEGTTMDSLPNLDSIPDTRGRSRSKVY